MTFKPAANRGTDASFFLKFQCKNIFYLLEKCYISIEIKLSNTCQRTRAISDSYIDWFGLSFPV
jgi:hypothetical protein